MTSLLDTSTSVPFDLVAHDLRVAIHQHAVDVVYQPIVDAQTGEVRHLEALLRWHRVGHGPVAPMEVIALAEANGLMMSLTALVLDRALSQLVQLQDQWPGLAVSVNLAASSLTEIDLVDCVAAALARHHVTPSALILELTEGGISTDIGAVRRVTSSLRALGVRIAVDDYGSGQASIGFLRQIEFDLVKIDRSIVATLSTSRIDAAIVRTTIDLAKSLDLEVVAEGVETREEIEILRSYGCNFAQGYFFSRPLTARHLDAWMAERKLTENGDGGSSPLRAHNC